MGEILGVYIFLVVSLIELIWEMISFVTIIFITVECSTSDIRGSTLQLHWQKVSWDIEWQSSSQLQLRGGY
jgi:hypothetical protein